MAKILCNAHVGYDRCGLYVMKEDIKPIKYNKEIFSKYKNEENLDKWIDDGFAETMWGLGYDMDCEESFNSYVERSPISVKEAISKRQEYKNNLYYLEHANRKIVGNYLFSYWRYWTHWSMGMPDKYEIDYLKRIIDILESKYETEPVSIDEYVKSNHFPPMEYAGEDDTYRFYSKIMDEKQRKAEVGVPFMIEENIETNTFEVCDSDRVFEIMDILR